MDSHPAFLHLETWSEPPERRRRRLCDGTRRHAQDILVDQGQNAPPKQTTMTGAAHRCVTSASAALRARSTAARHSWTIGSRSLSRANLSFAFVASYLLLMTTDTPSRWASSTHSCGTVTGNVTFAIAGAATVMAVATRSARNLRLHVKLTHHPPSGAHAALRSALDWGGSEDDPDCAAVPEVNASRALVVPQRKPEVREDRRAVCLGR